MRHRTAAPGTPITEEDYGSLLEVVGPATLAAWLPILSLETTLGRPWLATGWLLAAASGVPTLLPP